MKCEQIWAEARKAAADTRQEPSVFKGCGFAWITINNGRSSFAKFAKDVLGAHKNYSGKGFNIWYSKVYDSCSQNMVEHIEACNKAAEVLRKYDVDCKVGYRLD